MVEAGLLCMAWLDRTVAHDGREEELEENSEAVFRLPEKLYSLPCLPPSLYPLHSMPRL